MNVLLLPVGNTILRRSIVTALLEREHSVRLLLRPQDDASREWPARVEPWTVADHDPTLPDRAVAGCDVLLLLDSRLSSSGEGHASDGHDAEWPFVEAASRAGVRRWIRVSAKPGERQVSSQSAARPFGEAAAPRFAEWLHLVTTPVYGVGDDPITLFLIAMRSLPAVPLMSAAHTLQPLWHEDLARGVAAAVGLDASDLNRVVEASGPDSVTAEQLYDRVAALIDRRPVRLPVPDFVATHGAWLSDMLHLDVPFASTRLSGDGAEHAVDPAVNALPGVLGVGLTTLDQGLTRLARDLSEITPSEGVGSLEVKRFVADITGSPYSPAELLRMFQARFKEVMPIEVGVEPVSPQIMLVEGAEVTMALPGRGHVQIRIEKVAADEIVAATLRGHSLAGIVRFSAAPTDGGIRFEVMTCHTAANAFDWLMLTLGGARLQDAHWSRLVKNVVTMAQGTTDGVHTDSRTLTGDERAEMENRIRTLIRK